MSSPTTTYGALIASASTSGGPASAWSNISRLASNTATFAVTSRTSNLAAYANSLPVSMVFNTPGGANGGSTIPANATILESGLALVCFRSGTADQNDTSIIAKLLGTSSSYAIPTPQESAVQTLIGVSNVNSLQGFYSGAAITPADWNAGAADGSTYGINGTTVLQIGGLLYSAGAAVNKFGAYGAVPYVIWQAAAAAKTSVIVPALAALGMLG